MNREILVDSIYKKQEGKVTKKVINAIIGDLLYFITIYCKDGSTVRLKNFGAFKMKHKKSRSSTILGKTGESEATNYLRFTSGKGLKEKLNKGVE